MMLGVSGLMGSSGDGAAAVEAHESGGASGGSSEVGASSSIPGGGMEDIERSGGGGNRWPRQETLALLKIRSDMDVAFRDSSLKGPLWEEVSRKMAGLGFQRSAKKCKEKFENVYKYHKRTKVGRASKSDGKTYRFFDQLEALDNTPPPPSFTSPPPRSQPPTAAITAAPPMPVNATILLMPTVSSTSPNPLSVVPPIQTATTAINVSSFQPPQLQPPPPPPQAAINTFQPSRPHLSASLHSNSMSSSSTSSDEDIHMRRGKKRKWRHFFQRLMEDVIRKQEELQKKFLDTLEKRERDRLTREETWRVQEMARMNREHDLLVQERSIAAAKDAAVIAFLQKVTDQNNLQIPISNNAQPPQAPTPAQPAENPQLQREPPPPPPLQQVPALPSPPPGPPKPVAALPVATATLTIDNNAGDISISASSSRWPRAEVQALINLRTGLDVKYQDNGPKGPLWEEISAAMAKLGYNRSSKRCKEKWENINKYFKKVKESNKKRPEDSKTCPYFHQLEAIYKERAKNDVSTFIPGYTINPDNQMAPIMARPEQQWPLPDQQNSAMRDQDQDNESDHEEDDDDDEDEEDGGSFEIVTNKQAPSATNAAE